MSFTSKIETVTPVLAKHFLDRNTKNRKLITPHAQRLADAIARGAYVLTGQPIIIGESGTLLNGQHICHAIILAGLAIDVLVVRGLSNEDKAFAVMDRGKVRQNKDHLALRGERNANQLAAALSWLHNYHGGLASGTCRYAPEPDQIIALLDEHPGIRDWMSPANALVSLGFNTSMMAFCLYAMSRHNHAYASSFYYLLKDGIGLHRTHPAYLLRQRIISMKMSAAKLPQGFVFAITVKAWNAFAVNSEMGVLRFVPGRDAMPEFIGYPALPHEKFSYK